MAVSGLGSGSARGPPAAPSGEDVHRPIDRDVGDPGLAIDPAVVIQPIELLLPSNCDQVDAGIALEPRRGELDVHGERRRPPRSSLGFLAWRIRCITRPSTTWIDSRQGDECQGEHEDAPDPDVDSSSWPVRRRIQA